MLNLSLLTNKPREAREWARNIVAAYPNEKTAYCWTARSKWTLTMLKKSLAAKGEERGNFSPLAPPLPPPPPPPAGHR